MVYMRCFCIYAPPIESTSTGYVTEVDLRHSEYFINTVVSSLKHTSRRSPIKPVDRSAATPVNLAPGQEHARIVTPHPKSFRDQRFGRNVHFPKLINDPEDTMDANTLPLRNAAQKSVAREENGKRHADPLLPMEA